MSVYDEKLLQLTTEVTQTKIGFKSTIQFLRRTFLPAEIGGGWRQFLQEPGPATVSGTACIISSLVNMGVSPRDQQVIEAADFLVGREQSGGGWTKPELEGRTSLTLVTCLTLHALITIRRPQDRDSIARGIAWLVEAQNDDGGWGNLSRDQRSDITSTAYAIRALAMSDAHHLAHGKELTRGTDWISGQRSPGGSWGADGGAPGTIAHTAHAVEALLKSGVDPQDLHETRDWLRSRVDEAGIAPWIEQYKFAADYPGDLPPHSRLSWTHLTAERALIALLLLEVDPAEEIIGRLLTDIRERHTNRAYWQSQTVPRAAPSWAVLEATAALGLHLGRLDSIGYQGVSRAVFQSLSDRLAVSQGRTVELTEQCAALEARVADLEKRLSKVSLFARCVSGVVRWARTPAVRTGALLLVATGALVAYWIAADVSVSDRLVTIATILAPVLALLEFMRRRRRR